MWFHGLVSGIVVFAGVGVAAPDASAREGDTPPAVVQLARPGRSPGVTNPAFAPDTVLVRFKPGITTSARSRALTTRGARVLAALPAGGYVKVHAADGTARLLAALREDPTVDAVTLDYRRTVQATPNDTYYRAY